MEYRHGLSKTLILKGIQCPKALYLAKNPPDFALPEDPEREARYRAGTLVGILAQGLFPGGTEVPFVGLTVAEQVVRTRQLIDAGADVIYEASFEFDGIFVKVDLLVRDADAWQIHEVKMGTSVKEINRDDVAIQLYVLANCGLDVSAAFLVHVDNSYVRAGEIDVRRLFTSEDVTAAALARQPRLPALVARLRDTLDAGAEPDIDIGPYCHDPYDCDFIPYCWRHVPEPSVFDLKGRGADKFDLYYRGRVRYADLPPEELSPAQRFQVESTLERRDTVQPEGVRRFLDTLWYPLCFLDFETFDTPVPPFDGTRPYQKIPFQYSLHVQMREGSDPAHTEYLAEPGADSRRELANRLMAEIPEEACILTWNQAFEKGILRDLAAAFPDLADAVGRRLANVRDLMVPFKNRDVYLWPMNGSYSIKAVLPALVPELSYAELEVADGMAAMLAYHDLAALHDPEEMAARRRALLDYCRLDTLAMVRILEKLREIGQQDG